MNIPIYPRAHDIECDDFKLCHQGTISLRCEGTSPCFSLFPQSFQGVCVCGGGGGKTFVTACLLVFVYALKLLLNRKKKAEAIYS